MAKSLKDSLLFLSNDNQNIKEFPKLLTLPKTDSENSEEKKISKFIAKKTKKYNKKNS